MVMEVKTVFALLLMAVSLEASLGFIVNGGFRVFRGKSEQELVLLSDKERLTNAAKSGEFHVVELTEASQSGVTQENVNLNLDCLPWLLRYPNGSISWKVILLDEFENIRGNI